MENYLNNYYQKSGAFINPANATNNNNNSQKSVNQSNS